jgi:hypothetical protein
MYKFQRQNILKLKLSIYEKHNFCIAAFCMSASNAVRIYSNSVRCCCMYDKNYVSCKYPLKVNGLGNLSAEGSVFFPWSEHQTRSRDDDVTIYCKSIGWKKRIKRSENVEKMGSLNGAIKSAETGRCTQEQFENWVNQMVPFSPNDYCLTFFRIFFANDTNWSYFGIRVTRWDFEKIAKNVAQSIFGGN